MIFVTLSRSVAGPVVKTTSALNPARAALVTEAYTEIF
jgi:hypothetical protein